MSVPRVNVLGVGVSATNLQQVLEVIGRRISDGDRSYVCVAAAHSIMDCQGDERVRQAFNMSDLTTPDGMSLVWFLRLKGHRQVSRVYGPELLLAACERSLERGWSHYFYGGAPGVPEALATRLQRRFPGLKVAGTHSPPFRPLTPEEDEAEVRRINCTRPDILWVGIGSPRQERWMADHLGRVQAPVMIGVGVAFDFLSGRKPQAPRWMRRAGLEWLFRLASEPGRLWPRYRQYPRFLFFLILQELGLRG